MGFQVVGQRHLDRSRHIWRKRIATSDWKCCLCGAVSIADCPPENNDLGWVPERYERLTLEDRQACPYHSQQALGGR